MNVLDGGVGPHDGSTDATRPYVDGQYAHRLPPLSATPSACLDGANATIRGGGTQIPNAGVVSRGSTMRRWGVRVDPQVRKRPATGQRADQLEAGPQMSPRGGGMSPQSVSPRWCWPGPGSSHTQW